MLQLNKRERTCRTLDIGCGENKRKGSIGVDFRKTRDVDVIADVTMLPFREGSFDYIYSAHVIEHFSWHTVRDVAGEWVRVLKKGGTLEIKCPWLRLRALLFLLRPSWRNVRFIYGEQDHKGNYHHCGFSYRLLKEVLEDSGIVKVKRVILGYHYIPFNDDLHVTGIKR